MSAYNEEAAISGAVSQVLPVNYPCDVELIVADDGIADSTGPPLDEIQDDLLIMARHLANRCEGAELLPGAAIATAHIYCLLMQIRNTTRKTFSGSRANAQKPVCFGLSSTTVTWLH
jgi:glycosyltransferase involved in cell wall biosynthesis